MDRVSRYILFALIALGIVLRVRQFAACPSYWYDEAYLLLNIFHKSFVELLGPLREDQAAPPLFLWLLRGLYRLVGGSEGWMRLPALGASVGSLFLMVPLARRIAGRRGWLWAVAFCALSHHAIAHADEVKPYALDFLMSEVILLTMLRCQVSSAGRRSGLTSGAWWVSFVGPPYRLCLLAVMAPWMSYPSMFILGAVCVALLFHGIRHRCSVDARAHITFACAVGCLSVLSGFLVWLLVIRHQATSALRTFWAESFLDLSSTGAAMKWIGRCLIELGNYGTREMGLPLLMFALVGAASQRRRPARLLLLMGPIVLALFTAALRLYPLGGRLLFFLVPCWWLLAARGIGVLMRRVPVRMARMGWILPLILLLPELSSAGRLLVGVTPRCQFREAFAYVEAQRQPGDVLWVSHPQVYEVYYGRAPDLSAYSPPRIVVQAAQSKRMWMVCAVAGSRERYTAAETVEQVKAVAPVALDQRRFRGLQVVLYSPPIEQKPYGPSRAGSAAE